MAKKLIYDPDSNTWTGIYEEYPGCIAQSDTREEVEKMLDEVRIDWLAADKMLDGMRK